MDPQLSQGAHVPLSLPRLPSSEESVRAYREASQAGPRSGPFFSLETWSQSDQWNGTGWDVRVMEFPGGVVECQGLFVEGGRGKASGGAGARVERPPNAEREREQRERNSRRARQSLRRRVYMVEADRMLTLTARGKFQSLDDLWAAWARFDRLCKKLYRQNWRYVAVPELHSDQVTYHMHVALRGFYCVGLLRRFWYRALGGKGNETGSETPGNIDMSTFGARLRGRKCLAGYLCKYLVKNLSSRVRGRRSFDCSRGLCPLRITRWRQVIHAGLDAASVVERRLSATFKNLVIFRWVLAGQRGFSVYSTD